ncbi:DUF349 domain-containing protein [Leptobacterium flavescens]|uniref:DUF349 domain-containing protein n=1 Tax=Leptobacterium flavescens TaxID=472055 RepID=A0A6P0ULD7_9FLAO|nr:DUF349 domain-containing protein [Leptobacterium flavescens]NER14171.1 DUF349 domain-containing protein [Leptobacterium flavescens]
MLDEKKDNLPGVEAEGNEDLKKEKTSAEATKNAEETVEQTDAVEKVEEADKKPDTETTVDATPEQPEATETNEEVAGETDAVAEVEEKADTEAVVEEPTEKAEAKKESPEKESDKEGEEKTDNGHEEAINEIDESNAEDAEDEHNHKRHIIPVLDYHSMSMDDLVEELQKLVRNEKVQAIKTHVDGIKHEFDLKFQEFLEQKKEDFVNEGGNEIDFRYSSPLKTRFNKVYGEYKEHRNQYYKNLEQTLKDNLSNRLEIIEELKGLINVEENINTTYKHFKELQDRWRSAGPVPRMSYNDVWRTYHHHVEIFYDFLDLNRDLRDLDFRHNLEEKEKLVARAEELSKEEDISKAFRELQVLHKVWKEEIGPVDREHREDVWNRFSAATKAIHDRRQEYFKNLDSVYEKNLEIKNGIIAGINQIAEKKASNHNEWQKQIREIEALRESFFAAGKVPHKVNEATWAAFKEAVRTFNRNKNAFYKNLKKEQHDNYEKKLELVKLAESLKDSDDWAQTTPILKKVQEDWKKIGHVPRKFSDKIWNDFKTACNHYFDRLHAQRNEDNKEELEAFEAKKAFLDRLKEFELSGEKEKDLEAIKAYISEWKSIGRVPYNKKSIEAKFNKILDALFRKLDMDKQEAELLKYGNKLQQLAGAKDGHLLDNERIFIRRKIDELKSAIRQLENNLQFFSNASEDNPLVKDVVKNIDKHKSDLELWKAKLKKLRTMDD